MGASNSSERLNVKLPTQYEPFAATAEHMCAPVSTTLQVKKNAWSSKIQIEDGSTGQLIFEICSKKLGSRQILQSANGEPVATIKGLILTRGLTVLRGASETELFVMELRSDAFKVASLRIDFTDCISGERCRVTAPGNWDDRAVVIYLQRGEQAPLQPIARLRRPPTGVFSPEENIIEMIKGVDMALVVLVWLARDTARCGAA